MGMDLHVAATWLQGLQVRAQVDSIDAAPQNRTDLGTSRMIDQCRELDVRLAHSLTQALADSGCGARGLGADPMAS